MRGNSFAYMKCNGRECEHIRSFHVSAPIQIILNNVSHITQAKSENMCGQKVMQMISFPFILFGRSFIRLSLNALMSCRLQAFAAIFQPPTVV